MTDDAIASLYHTLPTVGDIRRARDTLVAADTPSALSVARALTGILRGGDAITLLGLKGGAGRRSALTLDRIAARNAYLRRMAARHYGGISSIAQAREISAASAAYQRRAARLDLDLDDMPASYAGMPREFLFHIARLPATVPSERTIRLLLARAPS